MIKSKLVWLVPLSVPLLTATAVQAFNYSRGINTVNVSGTLCQAATVTKEQQVSHAAGETAVNSGNPMRVFCPLPRRSTSYYQTTTRPLPPDKSERKVKLTNVEMRTGDTSSIHTVGCFVFGTRLSDQAVMYGATKFACTSSWGCDFVQGSFQGWGYLRLSPAFTSSMETVNWGVACDLAGGSKISYLQAHITPN